jgi:WW domain
MSANKQVIMLFTSVSMDTFAKGRIESLENLFSLKGVSYSMLDGADAENKDLRTYLFQLSGLVGTYPQVFIFDEDANLYEFCGDYQTLQDMVDEDAETRAFTKIFKEFMVGQPTPISTPVAAASKVAMEATVVPVPVAVKAAVSGSQWQQRKDKFGDVFWWNPATKESSWVDPTNAVDPRGIYIPLTDPKGRTYYYNRLTGKSSWKKPE